MRHAWSSNTFAARRTGEWRYSDLACDLFGVKADTVARVLTSRTAACLLSWAFVLVVAAETQPHSPTHEWSRSGLVRSNRPTSVASSRQLSGGRTPLQSCSPN